MAVVSNIHAKTAEAERRKRGTTDCLDEIRIMVVGKMEEASRWENSKKERVRTRLQDVARQAKTPKGKEIAEFIQHLEHEYAHIHVQLHTRRRLTEEQRATKNYQEETAAVRKAAT